MEIPIDVLFSLDDSTARHRFCSDGIALLCGAGCGHGSPRLDDLALSNVASRRSSIEDRRCGETNLELSPMKFLASASSEADRRATRRSKPPPGSSRARGSESLSMLREVGHPRSSSHAQFLRLALGVHAELVSLVRALRRWHRRLHRCLSAPHNFRIPQSSAHQQRTITGCAAAGGDG